MQYQKQLESLERWLGKADFFSSSNEAVFFCPFCHHRKKKLSINLQTAAFHCWVCGKSGRSLRFLLKSFCNEEEIRSIHKLFKNIPETKNDEQQQVNFIPSFPEGFIPLVNFFEKDSAKPFISYLASRNIHFDDILKFKLGVTFDDSKFLNRIIFPSFDVSGNLNYILGRTISNLIKPTYEKIAVPKGWTHSIILNELNIDFSKPLVIVEGFFDLFNAGNNATFLAGNDLSINSRLFRQIVEHRTKIYLCLDSDIPENQMKLANKFYRHGVEVYCVDVSPWKDPGSMTKQQFQEKLEKAKLFEERDLLLNRINNVY